MVILVFVAAVSKAERIRDLLAADVLGRRWAWATRMERDQAGGVGWRNWRGGWRGLRERHLLRELRRVEGPQGARLTIGGRSYLQFCTNNYLGLAHDPEVIAAAQEATGRYGTGSGAARLVAGSMALHEELEAKLAAFKGCEAALLFPTGFMANLAVLTTFAGEEDVVVSDKLNHASLLDGAKYSGCYHRTFPHRRYERAGELLMSRVAKEGGGFW